MQARILASFGEPAETLFQSFEVTPLASASLAQVHRATLKDGRQVAVKVQHYDIETMAEIDLRTFRRLLKWVGFFFKIRGLDHVYLQVREMILAELDFSREAEHLTAISANFADSKSIRFPQVVAEYSDARVLTTTFAPGIKITDLHNSGSIPVTRSQVATRLLEAYLEMLIEHGLYHADPHPGNLLIAADGAIVFLDFGAIGILSPEMKAGIPKFLHGVLERDPTQIQQALSTMGFLQTEKESETLNRMIRYLQDRFMGQMELDQWHVNALHFDMQTKFEIMADFRKLNISTREMMSTFQVPKSWVILHRTMILLLGLISDLDPHLKPIPIIRPFLQNLILEKQGSLSQKLFGFLKDYLQKSLSLPKDLHRVITKLERGEMEVQVKGYTQRTRLFYALGQQWVFAVGCIASGYLSYDAWKSGAEPLFHAAAGVSGICALLLVGSMFSARKWFH